MTVGEVVKADSPVLRTGEPAGPEHTKPFDKPYFPHTKVIPIIYIEN